MLPAFSFSTEEKKRHEQGGHLQASIRQQQIYSYLFSGMANQTQRDTLNVLDFGTAYRGASRSFLEGQIGNKAGRSLKLYDPYTRIAPPIYPNVSIIDEHAVFGINAEEFDVINLSYVLCCLDGVEATELLSKIIEQHPDAVLTVFDYVLKNRDKARVLDVLCTKQEMIWRKKMGDDAFFQSRSYYAINELAEVVTDAGGTVLHQEHLSNRQLRACILAN